MKNNPRLTADFLAKKSSRMPPKKGSVKGGITKMRVGYVKKKPGDVVEKTVSTAPSAGGDSVVIEAW